MSVKGDSTEPKFDIFNSVSDVNKIQNYRNAVPYFL